MSDLHSSCILFSPPNRASQQASIAPSGVGQHSPSIPIAAQPVTIMRWMLGGIQSRWMERGGRMNGWWERELRGEQDGGGED